MALDREIVFILLQFLEEEGYTQSRFFLEQESTYFFNFPRFEGLCLLGKWQEVEQYLAGFTSIEDNRYSMKMLFEIRKQKYLEALDAKDLTKATNILINELKIFTVHNDALFKEMTYLLTLDNFRENEKLCNYGDTRSARLLMVQELKKLVEANPALQGKLHFPQIQPSRLRTIISQTMDLQQQINNSRKVGPAHHPGFVSVGGAFPDVTFSNGVAAQIPALTQFPGVHSPAVHDISTTRPSPHSIPSPQPIRPQKRHQIVQDLTTDERAKRLKGVEGTCVDVRQATKTYDMSCLPVKIAGKLHLPSGVGPVTSLDYHSNGKHLLCGTKKGVLLMYDLFNAQKPLLAKHECQSEVAKDRKITRVVWASKSQQKVMAANLCGVAFADSIFQLYHFEGNSLSMLLEVAAHKGRVNDLAFARVGSPTTKLCALSCGDDKSIKVWDVEHGECIHSFVGHEGPVLSIWPHTKESISFVFSTSADGKIRAWLYFDQFHRVDYNAPGKCCTYIAYSDDGSRLFSCGMPKDESAGELDSEGQLKPGESCLTEWNETEGTVKSGYLGFRSTSPSARFTTINNKFLLAVSDKHLKFWDMDQPKPIYALELSKSNSDFHVNAPFAINKAGTMLAVASESESLLVCSNSSLSDTLSYLNLEEPPNPVVEEKAKSDTDLDKTGKPAMIELGEKEVPDAGTQPEDGPEDVSIPTSETLTGISKLATESKQNSSVEVVLFSNSGDTIVTLTSGGTNHVWRSKKNEWRLHELNEPMQNERGSSSPKYSCQAISRNDAYLLSSSDSQISLYNLLNVQHMISFSTPPPTASCLAFSPKDNNMMALGMDNGMIHIYNVRLDELVQKLKGGHENAVTGLLFCAKQGVLISVCKDSHVCMWDISTWELKSSFAVEGGIEDKPKATTVSIHRVVDEKHVLVAHPERLTILNIDDLSEIKSEAIDTPLVCASTSCDFGRVMGTTVDGQFVVYNRHLELVLRTPLGKIVPALKNETSRCISSHPKDPLKAVVGFTEGLMTIITCPSEAPAG